MNTVVVGAGQAGLAVSHLLTKAGISHVVVEKGRVGESWRSQRWDSFTLNTPNWANELPDVMLGGPDREAFADRDDLVADLEAYAASSAAPIHEQTAVTSVERSTDGHFLVETTGAQFEAKNVVVCSGSMSTPSIPAMAGSVSDEIETLSAGTYKNAGALAPGAVVVVGSGQSGCQIAEDLLAAGRTVYLCVSKVARIPRRYRGRDIFGWLVDLGFFDVAVDDLEVPAAMYAAQPQVSGTRGGHTISLQSLARDGAILLGRVNGIDGATMTLGPTVRDCVDFADEKCLAFKAEIDKHIADNNIDAPAAEPDPYEPDMPDLAGSDTLASIDLAEAGVSTMIWCVGFRGDFSWIRHDILDDRGTPKHRDGVSEMPGLYFAGFPWLSKRKSGILLGVTEDAERIVGHITSNGA